jgi:hypothetical protein
MFGCAALGTLVRFGFDFVFGAMRIDPGAQVT